MSLQCILHRKRNITLWFNACFSLDWYKFSQFCFYDSTKTCIENIENLSSLLVTCHQSSRLYGVILWQRTITLTFPVHELSALDWSEKWFLTCSSFTIWNIWMKLHRYVDHQRLHIVTKDRHSYLSRLWVIHPWLIWELVFGL